MAKKVETIEEDTIVDAKFVPLTITPIGQQFGNDDLNLLRDKINELVKFVQRQG